MFPQFHAVSLATAAALLLSACNPCDQSGCEAIEQHDLLCASEYTCIPIEVVEDETLTVNLYHPFGDEGYRVGRPDEELEDVATLRVELP